MRRFLSLAAVLALAACGGGGGGTSAPSNPPPTTPTTAPTSNYVTPQFTLVIPAPSQTSGKTRDPKYISNASRSVVITLTADSVGIPPGSIAGNPATTTLTAGQCASGCNVNGPPSPPGTDSFKVVTYDNAVPASGNALNAGVLTGVTITAGQQNSQSITLGGIPITFVINNVPPVAPNASAFVAGTQSQHQTVTITAKDADGNAIASGATHYVDANGAPLTITLSDPDTNAHGSCLVPTGSSTCTSGSGTTASFNNANDVAEFAYDGLAENPVTLTASASGATNKTATFQPQLNAPAFNGTPATPAGVALSGSPEIDLFAASGIGSTGTEYFTELGWTGTPYNHALTFANTGACTTGAGITATSMADIATIVAGTNDTTKGTPITATINTTGGAPKPGSCPSTISDGLSSNTTDGSATLTVTYTSLSITGQSKRRQQ